MPLVTFVDGQAGVSAHAPGLRALMDQAVAVFETASDRDAMLPNPSEGSCCYIKNTIAGHAQVYRSGAWTNVRQHRDYRILTRSNVTNCSWNLSLLPNRQYKIKAMYVLSGTGATSINQHLTLADPSMRARLTISHGDGPNAANWLMAYGSTFDLNGRGIYLDVGWDLNLGVGDLPIVVEGVAWSGVGGFLEMTMFALDPANLNGFAWAEEL